ncbi:MAG TPA: 50S ribosomal protein L13 [Elusimicrobiota bacterium]|nr:50S ribosomal protein L13 [Elusimicrobiota bacterium]
MLQTQTPRLKTKDISRRYFLLDGNGVVLGRLATLAANLLRGKGNPAYSPAMDIGNHVIVINADKVALTGNKLIQKIDFRASGYPGGQRFQNYGRLMKEKPERAVKLAVYGMLPKNRLRGRFMKRLKIFRGAEAQKKFAGAETVDFSNPKMRSGGPYVSRPALKTAPAPTGGEAS